MQVLKSARDFYLEAAYAPTTLAAYRKAWGNFGIFAKARSLPSSLPLTTDTLELYITFLHLIKSSGSVIKAAIAALSRKHAMAYVADNTKARSVKKLTQSVLKGGPPPKVREALSLPMLEKCLVSVPRLGLAPFQEALLKAVLLTQYYGCFRIGQLCLSTNLDHVLLYRNTEFVTMQEKIFQIYLDFF